MKSIFRFAGTALILASGVILFALRPDASTQHYVLTNNNIVNDANTGTILRLGGTQANPTLTPTQTLQTGQVTDAGTVTSPTIKLTRNGPDYCVYIANGEKSGNSISAFKYPGLQLVGNYSNSNIASSAGGIGIATNGDQLFADYAGYDMSHYVASWRIGAGCALSLLDTAQTAVDLPASLAVTPDGKTLILGYLSDGGNADSFSISANGKLTELGPFGNYLATTMLGMDLTADGKYAFFSLQADGSNGDNNTEMESFAVNPGGALTDQTIWGGDGSLGFGPPNEGYLWFSPNERFLFVSGSSSVSQITTLNFTESPKLDIYYGGCLTTLRVPNGEPALAVAGMATVTPTGAGGDLYVAEGYDFNTVGLLAINPSTGCTTEFPESPYSIGGNSPITSLAAWPPGRSENHLPSRATLAAIYGLLCYSTHL